MKKNYNFDNWLFAETSSGTVHTYVLKENKLIPFLIGTPSIDPEYFL